MIPYDGGHHNRYYTNTVPAISSQTRNATTLQYDITNAEVMQALVTAARSMADGDSNSSRHEQDSVWPQLSVVLKPRGLKLAVRYEPFAKDNVGNWS